MTVSVATTPLRGEWRLNEPLARYTSWRIGGPADRLYRPADSRDLAAVLAQMEPEEAVFWLGFGSNLLVRDGGLRATVIWTRQALTGLEALGRARVRAEAGVGCAKVARFAAQHDLVGGEFLAGIPGTVGGALAMNAGAWGGETWPPVEAVETVDRAGRQRERPPEDFRVGYRRVDGPAGEWFSAARLVFEEGDGTAARGRIRELLAQRSRAQPIGVKSCGSVFRNPPGDYAARLIEVSGLKGKRCGDAEISDKHANFIVNRGAATAADVEGLMLHIQHAVQRLHGVELVPEVRIVGEQA
jgi:UDP-N-acetylmuramate dehydrogenase